tara:strand:+ start:433 stop:774 length:342 start_codon:yes stop_codon:yes gene_type:complete
MNKNIRGIAVITEALLLISKIYKTMNKAERIKNVFLKTLIIDNECFIRLKKLIFDDPKYLVPLTDGTLIKFFSILDNEPEKLFQVAFSLIIFSTIDFGKQVKFPNFINLPVKV